MQQLDSSMFPGFPGFVDETPSRSSIKSKGGSDYSDWPGFEEDQPSTSTSRRKNYDEMLREIERRIQLGLPVDARDVDTLIDAGMFELPEDYRLEGGEYVSRKTSSMRSLGYQPSMAPGGDMIYGSGMGGALTGEDTRRILAMQPTGPTAEQISVVEGARGRIASRMRDEEQYGIGRPSVYDINQELERMRQLGTRERAKKPESKFERKLRKQREEDPMKWLNYTQSQQRLTLEQEKFAEKKASQAKVEKRWTAIGDWIIKHAGDPAYEPYIAKVEDLKKGFVESVDPLAAIAAIEAEVKTANAEAERKLSERIATEQRANTEFDRRRNRINEDSIASEQRAAKRAQVNDANKNSAKLTQEINEINDDIAGKKAGLAGLQELIDSLGEDEERIAEAQKAIQVQQIAIDRLEGELASKQARLSQMSGFGGTQALPESATTTNDFGDASGYPEGARARNANGQIIVVRNGRWVLE
jgi:hypothetical protein